MNMLEIGKLYRCEEYYLMLYPDKETAAVAAATAAGTSAAAAAEAAAVAAAAAAYWSKRSRKPVSFTEKNVPILVLNSKGKYIEVLAGDRKGWIISESWLHIKEIT